MQLSLPISPSKLSSIFPSHNHFTSTKPLLLPHFHSPQHTHFVTAINSLKSAGYLSSIGRAIDEEEEYRKARAAVIRKGIDLEGYTIEGVSVGGHETCLIIPEFKCAFDIGRCPTRAIQQNFVFITHGHLDHIVRLADFVLLSLIRFYMFIVMLLLLAYICIYWLRVDCLCM